MAISKLQARALVENHLKDFGVELDLIIIEDAIREESFGWIFFYGDRRFIIGKDFSYALAGTAPIIVDRESAELIETGTAKDIDHYVQLYKRFRLNPEAFRLACIS